MSNSTVATASDVTLAETVTSEKPRRVYPYRGACLICFAGARYESPEGSLITADVPVTKVTALAGNSPLEITVSQKQRGKSRPVTETWTLFLG